MRHYRIAKSCSPKGDMSMYVSSIKDNKYDKTKCCQLHINGSIILIEKYYTLIRTWNRKTKVTRYLNVDKLSDPDIKIVLYDNNSVSHCYDFTISWTHITPRHIYTNNDSLIIPLNDQFSYSIRSILFMNEPDEVYTTYPYINM